MADNVNANIRVNLDTSQAIAGLQNLQSRISTFNQSVIQSNAQAVAAQRNLLSTLQAQIGASGKFATSITNIEGSVNRLQTAIDKNKLSMGQYFRYSIASTKSFGRMFAREHEEITGLATERVKRLQTQYIALGESQGGMVKALQVRPLQLFNADMAIATQKSQIFNKLLQDGSTSLVNWGKNTQWAGRQLMVGFTVPLTIFGGVAAKIFMDLEKEAINFRKVYGDIFTTEMEVEENLAAVRELSKEMTKYGIAVKDTMALAGVAAQSGLRSADLMAATEQATRLAVLGQMEQTAAMETVISMQTAFQQSNEELAQSVDFLNIIENQTVLSLEDVAGAIPRVAPVIQGMGGDVKDLAVLLVAMREGGVSAAEGANALKNSLARLITPTSRASGMARDFGINLEAIVERNRGEVLPTIMELATAMKSLDDLDQQKLLSTIFGKFQYARIGALFKNITNDSSQAARAIELMGMSTEELAQTADQELSVVEDAIGVKFTGAVELLKAEIAPIGEQFLKLATPLVEFASKVLAKFNELSPTVKNFVAILTGGIGVVLPAAIMLLGLFGNLVGSITKGVATMIGFFTRLRHGGEAVRYLAGSQLDAEAAARSLEGRTTRLTGALNVQRQSVEALSRAYTQYVAGANAAASGLPQGFRPPPRRMATGGMVGGTGNRDTEPALLTPGEFVINADASKRFAPLLNAINSGSIGKYAKGRSPSIYGGQEVVLAPHTMLAPGNVPGGFGMSREFFTSGAGFEESLRATAVATAGIEGNIRLTEKAVAEMSSELAPYTQQIVDDLRLTAQEMDQSGKSAQHISEVFEKAQPRLQKTLGQMEQAGGRVAAAGVGLRKFAFPTEQEMMAEGERRVPGGTIAQSGAVRRTEYRSRSSASLSRIRSVYQKMFGRVPSGYTSAHVTPESQKLLGDVVPLRGAGVGMDPTQTAKLTAYIEKKSRENAATYSNTFSKEVARQDPTAKGLAMEAGRRSPHRQVIANATQDAIGYANNYGINLNNELSKKLGPEITKITGGASGPSSPWPGPQMAQATNNLINKTNQASASMSKIKTMSSKFGGALTKGSMKLSGATMGLSSLILGLSFMNNGVGEFAQKIMPAVFGITALQQVLPFLSGAIPMLANPMVATAAAVAALGIGMWKVNDIANGVVEKGGKLVEAMSGTTKSMEGIAEYFGKQTFVQELATLQASRAAGREIKSEQVSEAQAFIESDAGRKLIEDYNFIKENLGSGKAAQGFANQIKRAILSGALPPEMGAAIASAASVELKDKKLAAFVSGEIKEYIGLDGEKITNAEGRLRVYANIFADAADIQRAAAEASSIWAKEWWGGQVAMILTGRGTSDIVAQQLGTAVVTSQQMIQEQLAANELAYQKGEISSRKFLEINQQILESAKMQGATWEGVKQKFEAAYPDMADQTDIILQTVVNPFLDTLKVNLGQATAEGIISGLESVTVLGDAATGLEVNLFDPQKVREGLEEFRNRIQILRDQMDGASESEKAVLESQIKRLESAAIRLQNMQRGAMNIAIAVQSGQLSPEALSKLFEGRNEESVTLMLGAVPDELSAQFLNLVDELGGEGNVIDIGMNFVMTGNTKDLQRLLLATTNIGQTSLDPNRVFREVKDVQDKLINQDVMKTINATSDAVSRYQREIDGLNKKEIKNKTVNFLVNGYGIAKDRVDWFLSLDPMQQRTFLTVFRTVIAQPEVAQTLTPGSSAAGGVGAQAYAQIAADQGKILNEQVEEVNKALTEDNDKSGGEKTKSWLEQLLIDTKANLELFVGDLEKGIPPIISKLRGLGISEEIIEAIGAGPDGLKRAKELQKRGAREMAAISQRYSRSIVGQNLRGLEGRVIRQGQEDLAGMRLEKRGVEKDLIEEILKDEEAIFILMNGTNKEISQMINQYRALKNAQDPIDEAIKSVNDQQQEFLKNKDKEIAAQEEIISKTQKLIDEQEKLNSLDQDTIRNKQRDIEMLERQIDAAERLNEADERRIDSLNRESELRDRVSEALSRELDKMSEVEQEIKNAYQERIDALDKVASINDYIINQQKQQLDLSRAVSEGDVYAATAAAQAMRAASAGFATDQVRSALEQGMENQIAGLRTSEGLTREQAEQRIADIAEQNYQTSLKIRDIEDVIYQRNIELIPLKDQIRSINDEIQVIEDRIYDRETKILEINRQQLEPQQNKLQQLQEERKIGLQRYEEMIESLELIKDTDEAVVESGENVNSLAVAWHNVGKAIKEAREAATKELEQIGLTPPDPAKFKTDSSYKKALSKWQDDKDSIMKRLDAAIQQQFAYGNMELNKALNFLPTKYAGGMVENYGMGGKVMRYRGGGIVSGMQSLAYGGSVLGSGGRDSVPAMLMPGEFVVRKAMVEKYGTPLMKALNQGSFAMPRYDTGEFNGEVAVVSNNMTSNINAPVYNTYDMKFSISGTNQSADEIANKVMFKMKQIQNQQVRGNRGY